MPALSKEQIEEKVYSVLLDILKIKKSDIRKESRIKENLGADSLDVVTLLMALEEALDIQIPDEDAKGFITVGDTIGFIEKKLTAVSA